MAFDPLNLTDLGADQIVTEATMLALYNNPVEIAQRGVGAPWLNGVGALESLPVGSGTWVVPDGVYRVKASVCGAGGGVLAGGNSTFGALTGVGGGPHVLGGPGAATGVGGGASGGGLNIPGVTALYYDAIYPGFLFTSAGGTSAIGGVIGKGKDVFVQGFGGGSSTYVQGGGGGGTAIGVLSVTPGDVIAYTVASSPHGGNGAVVLEY